MNQRKEVLEYAKSLGFVVARTGKHTILKLGKGMVTVSVSPRCPHAYANMRKDLDRVYKEHVNAR